MDFGSSHVFTQVDSDHEELTDADFESPYGVYQPLLPATLSGNSQFAQSDVLYDNVIRDPRGARGESDEPIYDNRGFKPMTKPKLPERNSGDYAHPYDHLSRQSHPYEYAGIGSGIEAQPPPLPPMRNKHGASDDMDNPEYGAFYGGIYEELRKTGSYSKVRRADTNIVAIKFDKLVQSSDTQMGSPIMCGCCGAAMSHLSKTSSLYDGKFWVCEFCEFENPVAEGTSIPITEDSTYVLGQESGGGADTLVIFCVDVSGSMAVTTEVAGKVERKLNDEQLAFQAYQEDLDRAEERARQEQQEAVQAHIMANYEGAIEEQAQALAQFNLARTQSQAAGAPSQGLQTTPGSQRITPGRTPQGTPQGAGQDRVVDVEERYVAAPMKPVSYISRLQAMQSAIQQQVMKLESESSNKRVGLVAFNNDVIVVGDGSLDPVPLEGAGLTDKESLISLGQNFPLPAPISEVSRCLTDKIYSLTENGQTALGPALLISIAMASQKPGSKVIMCTDGMANVGSGKLHNMDNDTAYEEAAAFYDDVGDFARDSGVCVSVLTLEGEDCRAIELGSVADKTRGQVSIVNPSNLNQQFANILDDPVLATNVSTKMILHKGLYLRDSDTDNPESQATHVVGLVTDDSETTFEFGIRKKEVLYDNYGGMTVVQREDADEPAYESVGQTMIEGLERLPFQVQIHYTGRDGVEYLRILTMDRPVTKDRKFAEQNANVGVIGAHAAQSAAKLAVEGNYGEAQLNALVTQKLVQRYAKQQSEEAEGIYQTFLANMAPIQSEISRAQQLENELTGDKLEVAQGGRVLSEVESDSDDTPLVLKEKNKKRKMSKKMKQRRKNVSDHQASVFYKMKGATTKMFNKHSYAPSEVV